MFHTEDESAHIEKVANYTDPKGEKAVGVQIAASMTMDPAALDMFEPGLRNALYRTHDVISAQNAGGDVKPGAVVRRFDVFDRFACGKKIVGAEVVLGQVDLASNVEVCLRDATIDRIKIELLKNGVEIRMRIIGHPDSAGIGRLFELFKGAAAISITPPEAAEYEADDEAVAGAQADMLDERGPLDDDDDDGDDIEGDDPDTIPVVHECRWTKISRVDGSTGTRQCIGYTCLICRSYRSAEEAA